MAVAAPPIGRPTAGRSAHDLLITARHSLVEASVATTPSDRYVAAHLAALRAAAAMLAARGRPAVRTSRVMSAWVLLPRVAPDLAEWAAFFAAGAGKRAAAETGVTCVSHREADDLVRASDTFVGIVGEALGELPHASISSTLFHAS